MQKHKWFAGFLLTTLLTISFTPLSATAEGTLSLSVQVAGDGEYSHDLQDEAWDVSLYQLAAIDEYGHIRMVFDEESETARKIVSRLSDSGADMDAGEAEELALEAAALTGWAAPSEDAWDGTVSGLSKAPDECVAMENGTGSSFGLTSGIYLIISENVRTDSGVYSFQPSLVQISDDATEIFLKPELEMPEMEEPKQESVQETEPEESTQEIVRTGEVSYLMPALAAVFVSGFLVYWNRRKQ